MSILEKCEKIGLELRETTEGKLVIELNSKLQANEYEFKCEFYNLINKDYMRMHFFAVPNSLEIFKHNTENEFIGKIAKDIIQIEGIGDLAQSNIPLGRFVEELSKFVFNKSVHYSLPDTIKSTPKLIRLTNSLSVECQKINIVQQIMNLHRNNPKFDEIVKKYDELMGCSPMPPYSKKDRLIYKSLKREYSSDVIDPIYNLINLQTYIKCMVFDAFYGNVYEITEERDCSILKESKLNGCTYISLKIDALKELLSPNSGWILKLHRRCDTIVYAQIFEKTTKFDQTECTTTIKALAFDML